ncbi:uncharacterized protein ELE39_002066 [Cryptosporidium sp. chipmunk genotype I]|uniref:uncharacterized protein n=1 Tax=Cryptosporidium sp. chipmunk genotype I TaxID=1280935 RepID=UPI00351A51BC|nr:hypothetical protein ELE39_002066 [Cryptosporidium sp. chipmunk genotype I]
MNQGRNNSYKLEKSNLSLRQIVSKNIYPIEVLLKLYKPLNVPRSIFKLETVVQKSITHGSNNFSYSRNTGYSGQNSSYLERKHKNGYFNNQNKAFSTFETNYSPSKNPNSSEEGGASGAIYGYSWRRNNPTIVENAINQEPIRSSYVKPRKSIERTDVINSFSARNQLADLQEDMSSIEKILNKRFEKDGIDSEEFIRNKLVMALEGIDSRISHNHNSEALSGIIDNDERIKMPFSDKLIDVRSDLTDEKTHNMIQSDLKDISSSNNYYHGNYTSIDSRLFKSNIVKNNIFSGKFANNSRAVQNVSLNIDNNSFKDGNEGINNNNININLMGIDTNKDSSLNNFHNTYNNLRIDNQLIQNNHNIGLEIRQEIDMLDIPIWLYKESGSFTVNGPFSTKHMSSLWKSYTFTHKTLFTMTSKYVWGPINLFYPEVKSTFTYIPDLEVLSQRLTDVSIQNDKVEKIKSEDISSIISEINELQLNVGDHHISAPKVINNEKNSSITLSSGKDSVKVQDLKSNHDSFVVESQNSENSCEFEPKVIQPSSTKVPWGGVTSEHLKTKKEVINFHDILREEEISSKEKLRMEAMNRANNNSSNSEALNNKDAPKGWKRIPKERSSIFLGSTNEHDSLGNDQTKQASSKVPYSTNLNINNGNKWKGWGVKTGESANTELFEAITLDSFGNFSTNQMQKHNQKGFWEMCNSDSLHKGSVRENNNRNVKCNKVNDNLDLEVIDHKAECSFDEIDKEEMNKDFYSKESTFNTTNKPLNHKNKRKKGKKIDSSLLAFGIRSDKPRNLNYDLD